MEHWSAKQELLSKFNVNPQPLRPRIALSRPLLDRILEFTRALRDAGVAVSANSVIDVYRSIPYIEIGRRDQVYAAMLCLLVSRGDDIDAFDQVFRAFWEGAERPAQIDNPDASDAGEDARPDSSREEPTQESQPVDTGEQETGTRSIRTPEDSRLSYSKAAVLVHKDIKTLSAEEIDHARRLLRQMIRQLAAARARRFRPSGRSTRPAFRRMLRSSMRSGGFPAKLIYRDRKLARPRLILLCDVSGSMEKYTRFLLEFAISLRAEISQLDVGVFSTRLHMITRFLDKRSVQDSIQCITAAEHDWGGGTDIGGCLKTFNDRHAGQLLRSGSVMIILSDGWDCGDADTMREEISRLHRSVRKLIWLNPLLGGTDYQPLARGMRTALPYIDHFLPAHNLASLRQVAQTLQTVQ